MDWYTVQDGFMAVSVSHHTCGGTLPGLLVQRHAASDNETQFEYYHSEFYCTFFETPLDFDEPENGKVTSIAMRMYPAKVPESQRKGSIFTNPGGPGGSGHASLLRTGPAISLIFKGMYDVVSFDPRGINLTMPRVTCHATNLDRQLFNLAHTSLNLSHPLAMEKRKAEAELMTQMCRDRVGDDVLRSVTTVNVARDLDKMREAVGDEGLSYWGFSYGTTLGATYAAMFPDRVEKLALDGVVYAPEQYTSLYDHGMSAGKATNSVYEGFLDLCAAAGPGRCALARDNLTTSSTIRSQIDAIKYPIFVASPPPPILPTTIELGDVYSALFGSMYRPASWVDTAKALADLVDGNGVTFLKMTANKTLDLKNTTDSERGKMWGVGREMGDSEGGNAVSCGDAPPFVLEDSWREDLTNQSFLGGPGWFSGIVRCNYWDTVQPSPPRFNGTWGAVPPKKPIIFVSNTHDPITPLPSGVRSVELFGEKHARLLTNNGFGHCSTNHPSLCIGKALRSWFLDDVLFEEGLICQPEDGFVFPEPGQSAQEVVQLNVEDSDLWRGLQALSDAKIGSP